MQWLPISTSAVAATITPLLTKVPSPIRTRAGAGAVIHTFGSNSVPAPISRRPSRSASSTLPWIGQRAKASRSASSQWMRARFQGSELRSYQRHFCHQSRARRASTAGILSRSHVGRQPRDRAAHDERVHLARALVGVERLRVVPEARDLVLEQHPVAAEQLPRASDGLAQPFRAE